METANFLDWPARWLPNHDREYRLNAAVSVKAVPNGYFITLPAHECAYPCNGYGAYVDSWREVNGFLTTHVELLTPALEVAA